MMGTPGKFFFSPFGYVYLLPILKFGFMEGNPALCKGCSGSRRGVGKLGKINFLYWVKMWKRVGRNRGCEHRQVKGPCSDIFARQVLRAQGWEWAVFSWMRQLGAPPRGGDIGSSRVKEPVVKPCVGLKPP